LRAHYKRVLPGRLALFRKMCSVTGYGSRAGGRASQGRINPPDWPAIQPTIELFRYHTNSRTACQGKSVQNGVWWAARSSGGPAVSVMAARPGRGCDVQSYAGRFGLDPSGWRGDNVLCRAGGGLPGQTRNAEWAVDPSDLSFVVEDRTKLAAVSRSDYGR
jgi:hypothetical protein